MYVYVRTYEYMAAGHLFRASEGSRATTSDKSGTTARILKSLLASQSPGTTEGLWLAPRSSAERCEE